MPGWYEVEMPVRMPWQRGVRHMPTKPDANAYVNLRDHASAILGSILDAEQRAEYVRTGRVHVKGSAGGMYVLMRGYSGNVYRVDVGGCQLCAHPVHAGDMPAEVTMVAQICMLRTDEPRFLQIANHM